MCKDWRLFQPHFHIVCRNRFNASLVLDLRKKSKKTKTSSLYNVILPVGRQLFLPWNGSITKQLPKRLDKIGTLTDGKTLEKESPQEEAAILSDLTLTPSPGEQFSLTIICLDQLLNKVDTTIYAQVRHNNFALSSKLLCEVNNFFRG